MDIMPRCTSIASMHEVCLRRGMVHDLLRTSRYWRRLLSFIRHFRGVNLHETPSLEWVGRIKLVYPVRVGINEG
jgi:hypothetical protein